jgi:hypothetical protein
MAGNASTRLNAIWRATTPTSKPPHANMERLRNRLSVSTWTEAGA